MKTTFWMRTSLLGGAAVAATLLSAGCGGTSTATSSAQPAGPVAYGLASPAAGNSGSEVSGLGLPDPAALAHATTDPLYLTPTANDTAYATQATAVTPLGGTPAPLVGTDGVVGPPIPPFVAVRAGQAGVIFRAEVANGQTAGGGVPKITTVALTSADPQWTLGTLPLVFHFGGTAIAGPFSNAPYTTAPFTLPFTTQGTHTVSVTVTDDAGESARTDYAILVEAPTTAFVAVYRIDTGKKDSAGNEVFTALKAGDTATITGSADSATADAVGVIRLFTVPGVQTLTVHTTDAAKKPITFVQTVDLTNQVGSGQIVTLLAASQTM